MSQRIGHMTDYKVWDPLVRLFHWSLVAGFVANALLVDPDSALHNRIGYAILTLIGIRVLWGLVGPHFARFAAFPPDPWAALAQLEDIASGRRRVHLGHTPAGALMIYNLLATILLIGLTGYLMTTDMFWGVNWVETAHETLVGWAEFSVVLHVAAVLGESWRTRVNLPRAMVTGVKSVPDEARLDP
jgi:cytochrome b